MQALFGGGADTTTGVSPVVQPSVSMPMAMPINTKNHHPLLPSTGRGLLPKSMATGKTGVSRSLASNTIVPGTVVPFREHLKQWTSEIVTLGVGDHVLYKGADDGTLLYQATIEATYAGDGELEIRPLRNDADQDDNDNDDDSDGPTTTTRFVRLDEIQFYRPVREHDFVWVFTDGGWRIGEVLFISPFGQADLLLARDEDEYDDDDDDEEEHEEEQITTDVRDLCLTEELVPTVRLRQH